MCILILSTSENVHADAVVNAVLALRPESVSVHRFNVDSVVAAAPSVAVAEGRFHYLGIDINPEVVRGVFVHHPILPPRPKDPSDVADVILWRSGWLNMLNTLEAILPQRLWINFPAAMQQSRGIIHQLKIASDVGLEVPNTIITNDVEYLRAKGFKNGIAVLKSGPLSQNLPREHRLLTNLVKVDDVSSVVLQSSPCFFQERLEKAYEIRIHVIDNHVFACRIDSQRSNNPLTREDWRNYDIASTPHEACELPSDVSERCVRLTQRLGLRFGVIDLIVTKDGRYVFLECNSQASWLWIERLVGLSISSCIAQALLLG